MILESRLLDGRTGHEAGRALLAELYRRETGEPLPEIQITADGKPYFPDNAWHFSISHTKRRVFVALSRANVGIDAEELDRTVHPRLADKVLSPGERTQYDAAEDKDRAFLTFWVLKESAVKLAGTGLKGYPNRTDFALDDPRVRELDGCLVAVLTE